MLPLRGFLCGRQHVLDRIQGYRPNAALQRPYLLTLQVNIYCLLALHGLQCACICAVALASRHIVFYVSIVEAVVLDLCAMGCDLRENQLG